MISAAFESIYFFPQGVGFPLGIGEGADRGLERQIQKSVWHGMATCLTI